jgi:intein/homing endonuclease
MSRNVETSTDEWCVVENSGIMNEDAETIKITDELGNSIICTPEHKVWTENRGYVMAKDLLEVDSLKISESLIIE